MTHALRKVAPSSKRRVVWLPLIDASKCTGCGWCVAACPYHLLSLEVDAGKKHSVLNDPPHCTGCKKCAVKCPFGVITMMPSENGTDEADTPNGLPAGSA